jgi:toxin-antitoxin system PIN domain toxin
MIAVDTNLLVDAHRSDSDFHVSAVWCIRDLAEGRGSWAIPWPCIHEFFAIVTHPRVYDPPTPPERALDQIDAWLESPTIALLTEGESYWSTLRPLLEASRVTGPRVHDARIAALCAEHGVRELWTLDRDFGRFPSLPTRNPLAG